MQGNMDLHLPKIKKTTKKDSVHPGWRSRPLYTSRWPPVLLHILQNWMKSYLLRRTDEARWSMSYAFPATVGVWKMVDGRGRYPCVSIHHTDECLRAARPVPRGTRDWEACKEPSLRSPVPWQDGTMAPYATPCPMHGPWTRFPFKFEWGLAGRPDTVGPARDFRVLPHGMIIMGQGWY